MSFIEQLRYESKHGKPDAWSYVFAFCFFALFAWIMFPENNTADAKPGINYYPPEYTIERQIKHILPPDIPHIKLEKHRDEARFKQIASFVIHDLEGGDQITKEPNGGYARYGINTVANPEVNIWSLTKAQAYDIAKRKYWDPINLDDMSPKMQLVAFDTAFHHGPGKSTQKMIAKSKNNPYTLIQLRRQEYNRLVTANPSKYKKYKNGWENRLKKVEQRI